MIYFLKVNVFKFKARTIINTSSIFVSKQRLRWSCFRLLGPLPYTTVHNRRFLLHWRAKKYLYNDIYMADIKVICKFVILLVFFPSFMVLNLWSFPHYRLSTSRRRFPTSSCWLYWSEAWHYPVLWTAFSFTSLQISSV